MSSDAAIAATEVAPPTLVQKLAAELLGAFVLVFFGCGAAVTAAIGVGGLSDEDRFESTAFGGATLATIASIGLAFGIAVVAMAYAVGRISGGHFNPAVSVGAALGGRISWKDAGLYSAAQILGAIAAGLALTLIFISGDVSHDFGDGVGANGFGDESPLQFGLLAGILAELITTFIFVMIILAVTDKRNDHGAFAPLAIGLSLAMIHFATLPITGTSVNPARSIGAGLFSGTDAIVQLWMFILVPLVGGAVAGLLYPLLFGRDEDPVPGSGLNFSSATAAPVPGYAASDYSQQWNQGAQQPGQQTGAVPAQEQPIIQDGWQWDPQAQQWIPAQQPGPDGGWSSPGGDQTVVRPPQ